MLISQLPSQEKNTMTKEQHHEFSKPQKKEGFSTP